MARALDVDRSTPDVDVYRVTADDGTLRGFDYVLVEGGPLAVEGALQAALTARITDLEALIAAAPALLDALQDIIDHPAVPTVPAGVFTGAQATVVNALRDEVQTNRAGTQLLAQHLSTTVGGVLTVIAQLRDLLRLVRGDFREV